ncbi:MAG: SET domain-containing protein-lysine N-methyltransferase [bacterium]|nr:SET domain-containing protein-lysine N-methyltransferase [bacterium]
MSSPLRKSFNPLILECETPAFIYDLRQFYSNVEHFKSLFPEFKLFYSTKTNSLDKLLSYFNKNGDCFDAASIGEIRKLLNLGVNPKNMLFTHPIKFDHVMREAYALGVRKYSFDSLTELKLLSENAPGSTYMLRILPPSEGKFYEYSDKFGASPKDIEEIFIYAIAENVAISGICFHIGSQNMELAVWKDVLLYSRELIKRYYKAMPCLRILNIGSGFPAKYQFDDCPSLEEFSKVIHKHIKHFPKDIEYWCEPGRVLVADTAQLVLSVIRSIERSKHRWVFVNFGLYHGLIEILESRGKLTYKIEALKEGKPVSCSVSGNTLDPDDTLAVDIMLPNNLDMGDRVILHDVGAYSSMFFTEYHALPAPHYYFINDVVTNSFPENDNIVVGESTVLNSELGIYAKKNFKKDEHIFTVEGIISTIRTKYSLQVDSDTHIEPIDEVGNFLWGHYLNHSCDGNVHVKPDKKSNHIKIYARRDICSGEEIALDYAVMESEVTAGIVCLCDAICCRGKIVGFKDLPLDNKRELLDEGIVPEHLKTI